MDMYKHAQQIDTDKMCNFEIIDFAGAEEFTLEKDQFLRDADALLFCASITSRDSMNEIQRLVDSVCRVRNLQQFDVPALGTKATMSVICSMIGKWHHQNWQNWRNHCIVNIWKRVPRVM